MPADAWAGWRLWAKGVGFIAAYVLLVAISYRVAFTLGASAPLWWPPGGFALGILVRSPRRAWPAFLAPLFVVLLVLGLLGIPSQRTLSPGVTLAFALADVTTPLLGASLIRRFGTRPFDLARVSDVVVFAVVGVVVPSFLGAFWSFVAWLVWVGPRPEFQPVTWWTLEAFGILTMCPPILTHREKLLPGSNRGEAVLLTALLLLATWASFVVDTEGANLVALATAAFPLLSWAAVRFGPRGAAGASFAFTVACTWLTVTGRRPFGQAASPTYLRVAHAEAYLALATLSSLLLAAFGEERHRLIDEVRAEARHTEEALALLDGLLRSAPLGVAIYDRNLKYLRVNEALARINGQPPEGHVGKRTSEVLPGLGKELERNMRAVLTTGTALVGRQITTELPSAPGQRRSLLCTWFPIVVPGRPPVGVGTMVLEVTERVEAERGRERALARAEEALRVRDDFLSIASHELKTPLTGLSIRLQSLQRAVAADRPVDPVVLAKARSALERLTALANDLLDVSRIREGRLGVEREPLALRELVREVVGPYADRPGGDRLEVTVPHEEIWIAGDRTRVAQVLDNLIDNAFKYSPAGGRVRVSLSAEEREAHLVVADEGIGVPPADRERIFERFQRATNASVRSYGGLGLGLYISRDIVEQLGGRIWLEDAPGPGATFHVVLPRLARA
jgi:PAS domain S-box-containing protein